MKVTVLESVLAVRWCFSVADCNISCTVHTHYYAFHGSKIFVKLAARCAVSHKNIQAQKE